MALTLVGIGVKVSGRSAWLDKPAADAYKRMLADGCPTGGITDAGRTNAEQWDMWRAYLAGKLKATAAYPGTSKHETGRALDLAEPARTWVRQYGAAYGWHADRVRNEPWHFEWEPTTHEEDDMAWTPEERNLVEHLIAMVGEVPGRTAQAVANVPVSRVEGKPTTWLQDTADTGTLVRQLLDKPAATVAALNDTDLTRIAKAVTDEQARRLTN